MGDAGTLDKFKFKFKFIFYIYNTLKIGVIGRNHINIFHGRYNSWRLQTQRGLLTSSCSEGFLVVGAT